MRASWAISLDEILGRLRDRAHDVALTYAPGGHIKRGDRARYWALNPGRADRSAGSFVVNIGGARQGSFHDFASGEHGDMLDLIGLSLGTTDKAAQIREARQFLGLDDETPEARAAANRRAATAERARKAAEAEAVAHLVELRRAALSHYMRNKGSIRDTLADRYLLGRGIDLRRLGRQPSSLAFAPELKHPETGRRHPALIAKIDGPEPPIWSLHRIWLEELPDGRVVKLTGVEESKRVYCEFGGGWVLVSKGRYRVGFRDLPEGAAVLACEGIEDALILAIVKPELPVVATISVDNFAAIRWPAGVRRITWFKDNDPGNGSVDLALARAGESLRQQNIEGRVAAAPAPFHDLNDWLLALRKKPAAPPQMEPANGAA